LVLNEVKNSVPDSITSQIQQQQLELIGAIPTDALIEEYALEGRSFFELPNNSAALKAVREIADRSITP
jgi:CO dehydrogenase nickel-insertion accessory protein CooC1